MKITKSDIDTYWVTKKGKVFYIKTFSKSNAKVIGDPKYPIRALQLFETNGFSIVYRFNEDGESYEKLQETGDYIHTLHEKISKELNPEYWL